MMEKCVIDTRLGKIRGKYATNYLGNKYYSFQGIPYAKAPIGNWRFKDPQPIENWGGELDATKEGPACPSIHLFFMWHIGNEDNCLNLNIYVNELPKPDEPLKPVMIWIHGGAFVCGSNSTESYGPEYLMTENVIQVVINYRLGMLGFLCLEDETLEVTGNAGLKDQVMALQWVKNNISSFGGDPNNITIYGQSAGAASVHYLVLSSRTKGLFHKAIIQSGTALSPWAQGQRGAKDISKYLDLREDDERKILDILQKMSSKELVTAQKKIPDFILAGYHRPFGPVIEKHSSKAFLYEDPLHIMKTGNYNKVPMIIGMTSNEGSFFEALKKIARNYISFDCAMEIPNEFESPSNTEAIVKRISEFYELSDDYDEEKTSKIKSDNLFVHGIHRFLNYHLQTSSNPMYCYKFSFEGQFNHTKRVATTNFPVTYFLCQYMASISGRNYFGNMFEKMANAVGFRKLHGCSHADEIPYLFGCILSRQMSTDSREEKTMKRMVKLWTNFAKYNHPTPKNEENDLEIQWTPVEKHQHHFLDIGDELTMRVNPFEDRNKFWDDIYKEYLKN